MQQGSETHFKWSMLLNVSVFKAALQAIFTRGRKKMYQTWAWQSLSTGRRNIRGIKGWTSEGYDRKSIL